MFWLQTTFNISLFLFGKVISITTSPWPRDMRQEWVQGRDRERQSGLMSAAGCWFCCVCSWLWKCVQISACIKQGLISTYTILASESMPADTCAHMQRTHRQTHMTLFWCFCANFWLQHNLKWQRLLKQDSINIHVDAEYELASWIQPHSEIKTPAGTTTIKYFNAFK